MPFIVHLHLIKLLLTACLLAVVLSIAPPSLRQVNVVYRHGDRSPVTTYPKDLYPASEWPQGYGWLSQIGMRQQYALGQYLRSEYGSLLNATYKNTEIFVQSSNVNRCLMSAYCNLAGLYPPEGSQVWNPQLLWQPIPVHTRPEAEDNTLALGAACPRYDELYAQELNSPEVKEEEKINAAFYELMEQETGVKKENISAIWRVVDTLICEKAHNLTLPDWVNLPWNGRTVYAKLMELKDWGFALLYKGMELSRLMGGPLLKEIIQNMNGVVTNNQYYKMQMYSAHDSTVAAVTDAMSVYNQIAPPYATAVLVELHFNYNNNGQGYCVKIRFRNQTSTDPFTLIHPDCKVECCPFAQFVTVTKNFVPVDWQAECKTSHDVYYNFFLDGTNIALGTLFFVLLVIIIGLLYSYYRQRRGTRGYKSLA